MNSQDDLVSHVLQSPTLRNAVENCIREVRNTTPHSSAVTVHPTSQNVSQELSRLFPTIRRNPRSLGTRTASKKRKCSNNVFSKEVILLKSPNDCHTLRGLIKSRAFEEGFALLDVSFETDWTEDEILQSMHNLFQQVLQGSRVEILVPMGGRLIKPSLPPGKKIYGHVLKSLFSQKTIYLRPLTSLIGVHEEVQLEITDKTEPLHADEDFHPRISANITEFFHENDEVVYSQFEQDTEMAILNSMGNDNECSVQPFDLFKPKSFKEIWEKLQENITVESTTKFNIYRPDLFKCCLRALKRPSFLASNKIDVLFTDCDNVSEGAVDAGGPSKEMFRLLFNYFGGSHLFTGPEGNKFITFDKESLDKNHYHDAARLIAMGIVHCGFGPGFFSKTFFTMLLHGPDNVQPTLDDVYDNDIKNEISMAIAATDLQSLRNVVFEGTFIRLAGWEVIGDFAKKDIMITDIIKFYTVMRYLPSFNQFVEGLKTLNVYSNIQKYPEYFIHVLCPTEENTLNLEMLEQNLVIKFSEAGSTRRQVESRISAYWRDYLMECAENDEESCTLQEVLTFCTAMDHIPPCGFMVQPTVHFLHDDVCPYPKGNTCGLELHLPTVHIGYEEFKYHVTYGIQNGMVFGQA